LIREVETKDKRHDEKGRPTDEKLIGQLNYKSCESYEKENDGSDKNWDPSLLLLL